MICASSHPRVHILQSKGVSVEVELAAGLTPKVGFKTALVGPPNHIEWHYEGEWAEVRQDDDTIRLARHGYGSCRWHNRSLYMGQWVNDRMHGKGN